MANQGLNAVNDYLRELAEKKPSTSEISLEFKLSPFYSDPSAIFCLTCTSSTASLDSENYLSTETASDSFPLTFRCSEICKSWI